MLHVLTSNINIYKICIIRFLTNRFETSCIAVNAPHNPRPIVQFNNTKTNCKSSFRINVLSVHSDTLIGFGRFVLNKKLNN